MSASRHQAEGSSGRGLALRGRGLVRRGRGLVRRGRGLGSTCAALVEPL